MTAVSSPRLRLSSARLGQAEVQHPPPLPVPLALRASDEVDPTARTDERGWGTSRAGYCALDPMPIRATKRGNERGPLSGSHGVLICGASFAGLAVARELSGSGADVMVIDRYAIGERQTSACGIPTEWLMATGLIAAERQRFDSLLIHTPHGSRRYRLP